MLWTKGLPIHLNRFDKLLIIIYVLLHAFNIWAVIPNVQKRFPYKLI